METNKLFHFLRGLTTPSPEKWSAHFTKLVKQLAKLTQKQTLRISPEYDTVQQELTIESTLCLIDPYVKRPSFKNSEDELSKARHDLFLLWDLLLKILSKSQNSSLQTKCYQLLFALMIRQEFSLLHLQTNTKYTTYKIETEQIEAVTKYLNLLIDTFIYVVDSVSLQNGNLVQTLKFCANVLALLFFRFPEVQSIIIEGLKRKKLKIMSNDIYDRHKRRSVVKDLTAKQKLATFKQYILQKPLTTVVNGEVASMKETKTLSPSFTPTKTTPLISIFKKESDLSGFELPPMGTPSVLPKEGTTSSRSRSRYIRSTGMSSLKRSFMRITGGRDRSMKPDLFLLEKSFIESTPDLFRWASIAKASNCTKRLRAFLENKENSPECITWLVEKETFFITFLTSFLTYVNSIAKVKIEWSSINGFDLMLDCFWPLMKSYFIWKNTAEMQPERAVGFIKTQTAGNYVEDCFRILLSSEPSLVDELIYLCLCEINVVSYKSVVVGLDQIRYFIEYVGGTHFKVEIYWFGIVNCLKQENANITRKIILHLYDTLSVMRGNERYGICVRLLNRFFYKLFLHWSPEVRLLFHALLVFKFFRTDRRKLNFSTDAVLFTTVELPNAKKYNHCTAAVLGNKHHESKDEEKNHIDGDAELLADKKLAALMDNFIQICLEGPRTDNETSDLPEKMKVYIPKALQTYTQVLGKYYAGEPHDTTAQILKTLLSLLEETGSQKLDGRAID